jgi:hypothetical protein
VAVEPHTRGRGRHFLRSSKLAAELVRAAQVERDDLVLDLGAGALLDPRALLASADVIVERHAASKRVRAVVPRRRLRRRADELGFTHAAQRRDLDAGQWAALYDTAVRRLG